MTDLFWQSLLFIFIAATFLQVAAWIGIFARLARYVPPPMASCLPKDRAISVIICARNEADNLLKNLPAVLEQQFFEFEVLVVDDDSSDETLAVLHNFLKRYQHLSVLRVSPKTSPGKKQALALGIDAARSEYLVFTDADCCPASPYWLQGLANCGQTTEIVLGYAPYYAAPGLLNRWSRFETVQTAMQYFSFALIGQPYMGVGRNLAWRKTIFARVGGYARHRDLASGDDDLVVNAAAHRKNTAICLDAKTFMVSDAEKNWHSWWRQKQRHLTAGMRYRPQHQLLLGALALTHCLHYFLLIPLCFFGFGTICVPLWAVRMAPAFLIYWKILRQFREEQLLIWFPLFDALLALYYAAAVSPVLIRSNSLISWK